MLLLDNDTIRTWYQLYREDGIGEGLASFGHEGGACRLTVAQQDKLKAWIAETLPRTTRAVGGWIAAGCGIEYQTRSGLISLCCTAWALEHPQADSDLTPRKAGPGETGELHQGLRHPDEPVIRR